MVTENDIFYLQLSGTMIMKKIYAVNGSCRKNFNTAQALQSALDGAAAA